MDKNDYFWYIPNMSNQQMIKTLKSFQKSPTKSKLRREYFSMFEKRMAYRTTKTENPGVTLKLVEKVFRKLAPKKTALTHIF